MSRCLLMSVYLCLCVYMCVLSIGLSGGGLDLSGGRSVYMFAFLSVSLSVVDLSMCLFACLCLSISVCLSVCLSLSLSVYLFAVGRSSVFLSCRSVTVCTKRAGSGGEDAESESGRLRTQERQVEC